MECPLYLKFDPAAFKICKNEADLEGLDDVKRRLFGLLSKMKVGLSNHRSVCLPPPPPPITFEAAGNFGTQVMPFKPTSMHKF
jgi:hypothetical protein